jgi:hypothetical protein
MEFMPQLVECCQTLSNTFVMTRESPGRVYPLELGPISIVRSGMVGGSSIPGQSRPYLPAGRDKFLRMWEHVVAVLRGFKVRVIIESRLDRFPELLPQR